MDVLLIGSGGREHALAYGLFHSNSIGKLYCAPGNPGIFNYCRKADIDIDNFASVVSFCKKNEIDLVLVGPEKPLADGIADFLNANGIKVFGPSAMAAKLESSKSFAKDFMKKYGIPTAEYQTFSCDDIDALKEFIKNNKKYPVVFKADGLAAGKGVIIVNDFEEAESTINQFLSGKFAEAGKTIVVEEFLNGEEASILAVCDGKNYVTLASSQDHKRIYDGDKGVNTGGMGAYSPAPVVTADVLEKVKSKILNPVIAGMAEEGHPFIGCLYAGIMIDNGEPSVVEFNVRFGDPETQAVLANFKGDFARLLLSAAEANLDIRYIDHVCDSYSCCVIMASKGYPENYPKGQIIKGIKESEKTGAMVFHAGTKLKDDVLMVSGGRVLGVTGIGAGLKEAVENAYNAVALINFDDCYYRKDIGFKALNK